MQNYLIETGTKIFRMFEAWSLDVDFWLNGLVAVSLNSAMFLCHHSAVICGENKKKFKPTSVKKCWHV